MILFDMIMKGPDSYWKKQYNAERIRRQRAEANAKCFQDEADYEHESVALLSDKNLKQARALDAFCKEIEDSRKKVQEMQKELEAKNREIALLHEALRSERDMNSTLRTNSKLWENLKKETVKHAEG